MHQGILQVTNANFCLLSGIQESLWNNSNFELHPERLYLGQNYLQ